jgi:hypothetical protein
MRHGDAQMRRSLKRPLGPALGQGNMKIGNLCEYQHGKPTITTNQTRNTMEKYI